MTFIDWLLQPTSSTKATFISLDRLDRYISWMNCPLPPRLEKLAMNQGKNLISLQLGINAPSALRTFTESYSESDLKYENSQLYTSFMINFWDRMMTLFIIILMAGIFTLFDKVMQRTDWKRMKIL